MARDDRLKKVQDAGADFLETARSRAEEFLRELSRASGDTQGRAQGAIDDLVEGGRRGTEQLVSVIRKEITNQLGLLGLATKDDLDRLERRLGGRASTAGAATKRTARTGSTTARRTTAAKTAAASKKAANSSAAAQKATARKTAARKTAATKTGAKKSTAGSRTEGATKKVAAKKAAR